MNDAVPPGSAIEGLATHVGIEIDWIDAHGAPARVGRETLVRLLTAMGIAAADEREARDSLAGLQREVWSQTLPPVLVHRPQSGPLTIPLTLAAETGEVHWRLEREDGSIDSGRVGFEDLPLDDAARVDGCMLQRRLLTPRFALTPGHHRFSLGRDGPAMALIVTPQRCWLPETLGDRGRIWGIAAQLYLLRSDTDWGIGDYGDLCGLVDLAAGHGADLVGLNPLHALFPDVPQEASPYSPSSRLLLNPLNIDLMAVLALADCREARELIASEDLQRDLALCRAAPMLDYVRVTAIKLPVLRLLFDACMREDDGERRRAFEAFRRGQGAAFERHCLYLALRGHFAALDPACAHWQAWPHEYRDPESTQVIGFAREHRQAVDFVAWTQWIADEQLEQAATLAKRRSMKVGLYRDLAIGADRGGAETWSSSSTVVADAQVGAPPDVHLPSGQDWGLPPFDPRQLRANGYRDFIELVRANMRHAGGLRIDHVMGLSRLWWVPRGMRPGEGAYVRYPLEDLLGILALESHRQRCLVVGEDLGTVPEGFRERAAQAGVLSYRVVFFERDPISDAFVEPPDYPREAVAVLGSHDLPTLSGWWEARDLDLKERLGLFPTREEAQHQRAMRERDRAQLIQVLVGQCLLEPGVPPDALALSRAAHAFIARSRAAIAIAQIDDLAGEMDPVNLPATSLEHPNWRRRQSVTLKELVDLPSFVGPIAELRAARRPGVAGATKSSASEP